MSYVYVETKSILTYLYSVCCDFIRKNLLYLFLTWMILTIIPIVYASYYTCKLGSNMSCITLSIMGSFLLISYICIIIYNVKYYLNKDDDTEFEKVINI